MTEIAAARIDEIAKAFQDGFTNGNGVWAETPEHHKEAFREGARCVLRALPTRPEALVKAAREYVEAVEAPPELDAWDTEDGKEAPGAARFASDWSWKEHDERKWKTFEALQAALVTPPVIDRAGEGKTAAEIFSDWVNVGPKFAKAAGCYVGIKISASPPASTEGGRG